MKRKSQEDVLFRIPENYIHFVFPRKRFLGIYKGHYFGYDLNLTKNGIYLNNGYRKEKSIVILFKDITNVSFKKGRVLSSGILAILELLFSWAVSIKYKLNSKTDEIELSSQSKKDIKKLYEIINKHIKKPKK